MEYAGDKDAETGERFLSLKTFLIALFGLTFLVVATQLIFHTCLNLLERYIVKDPAYQTELVKRKIKIYLITDVILMLIFIITVRFIFHEPEHLFY